MLANKFPEFLISDQVDEKVESVKRERDRVANLKHQPALVALRQLTVVEASRGARRCHENERNRLRHDRLCNRVLSRCHALQNNYLPLLDLVLLPVQVSNEREIGRYKNAERHE